MGHGFEIPSKTITHSVPDPATGLVYNENTDTLEWKPVVNTPLTGVDGVKYAEITYRISINDSILDVDPLPADGLYMTNGDAKLSYTDVNGNAQTAGFPKPTVKPTLYVVEKKLFDASGAEVHTDEDFTIQVTGNEYLRDFVVNPSDVTPDRKDRVITDLRIAQTYTAREMPVEDYSVTYTVVIDGTTESQSTTPPEFTVDENHQFHKVIVENRPAVGELQITKSLAVGSSEKAAGATYTGTYTCTKPAAAQDGTEETTAKGRWSVTGAGAAVLTPDEGYPAADRIPAKSTCAVSEDVLNEANTGIPDPFYSWGAPQYSATSIDITKETTSTVTVTNSLAEKPGALTWTKVDEKGALLAGSEWTLTGPTGKEVPIADYVGQTDYAGPDKDPTAGSFKILDLSWGTYTLKETAPPAGYVLDATAREVRIGWRDGATSPDFDLEPITNTKITPPALPLTGGMGEDWFLIAAGGAGGIALLAALAAKRKKRARA